MTAITGISEIVVRKIIIIWKKHARNLVKFPVTDAENAWSKTFLI